MNTEPPPVRSAYEYIKKELSGIYSDREIYSLSNLLLEHILGKKRHELRLHPPEISPENINELYRMISRLQQGEPVQHILGYTEFCDLKLKVTPDVLVPRPETEELVHWILECTGSIIQENNDPVIMDIGTGSGCIALTLKKNIPASTVVGTDNSAEALQVARENAIRHSLDVRFLRHDILKQEWPDDCPSPDIIVSNPPYVPFRERKYLEKRVSVFEPAAALFVPDDDPLLFYKAILEKASCRLKTGARLFFEIHEDYAMQVIHLLNSDRYTAISLRKDIHGKDRMVTASCR